MVVLGLVTTKRPELESKDDLKRRIDEASRYVPLEQLCLSPQCGFSSTVEGNALTRDEQIAKLRLVVETAGEVWGWNGFRCRAAAGPGRPTPPRCWRRCRTASCLLTTEEATRVAALRRASDRADMLAAHVLVRGVRGPGSSAAAPVAGGP